jgi:hypothetical protein
MGIDAYLHKDLSPMSSCRHKRRGERRPGRGERDGVHAPRPAPEDRGRDRERSHPRETEWSCSPPAGSPTPA